MSFKLLNVRHAQKSKLDQKPSNFFRRFLSFGFLFFCLSFSRYKLLQKVKKHSRCEKKTSLERSFDTVSFRDENNLKKDKTIVDPVFKKPGIYII